MSRKHESREGAEIWSPNLCILNLCDRTAVLGSISLEIGVYSCCRCSRFLLFGLQICGLTETEQDSDTRFGMNLMRQNESAAVGIEERDSPLASPSPSSLRHPYSSETLHSGRLLQPANVENRNLRNTRGEKVAIP